MAEKDEDIVRWYVVGTTSVRQEIKIRDGLRLAGMESYVPMSYEAKKVRGRLQRKAAPAISGLVFVHTSVKNFLLYAQENNSRIYIRKSTFSNHKEYLYVNEQQMELFMQLTTAYSENVTYHKPEEVTLHEGDLVEITLGSETYQAEIKRVKGKRNKELVVEIPDVTIASIELTPDVMKLIKRLPGDKDEAQRLKRESARTKKLQEGGRLDERKSRNLEVDKKALFDTAFRLLFVIRDEYKQEMEYHLAIQELRRIRERLIGYRGFIAAQEGELALAMFLANSMLGIEVEEATERMRVAIGKLRDTSMLKKRMRFYLAKLSGDEATVNEILEEMKGWNKLALSERQREFMEEAGIVQSAEVRGL